MPQECGERRLRGSTRLARGAHFPSWVTGSSLQKVPVVRIQPDALRNDLGIVGSDCEATHDQSSIQIGLRVYVRPPRSVTTIAGFVSRCQTRRRLERSIRCGMYRTFAAKRIFGTLDGFALRAPPRIVPRQAYGGHRSGFAAGTGDREPMHHIYRHLVGKTLDHIWVGVG